MCGVLFACDVLFFSVRCACVVVSPTCTGCPVIDPHCPHQELAEAGLAGRSLPPGDQVLLVITDSVMQQLDALKADGSVGYAVRRFFREVLEVCGPAGMLVFVRLCACWYVSVCVTTCSCLCMRFLFRVVRMTVMMCL